MGIRSVLLEVANTYDETAGTAKGVAAQDLLRSLRRRTDLPVPPGFTLKGYGGNGFASSTPWIGVYDPNITLVPHDGLYLAYIFSSDLDSVTLTLQQGVTRLKNDFEVRQDLYAELERRAHKIRRRIPRELIEGWIKRPQFQGKGWRPRAYEASSVAARRYDVANMPAERIMSEELLRLAEVLGIAAGVNQPSPQCAEFESTPMGYVGDADFDRRNALEGFKPKDGRDYIVKIEAHVQEKSQRHEPLILDFAQGVESLGYKPITEGKHPRDLVLRAAVADGREWLVEAKVVRKGNTTHAVRECLAQLFEYSHFHYRERGLTEPHLVGLFTESVGAYASYLERHGVASVWKTEDGWAGSPLAVSWGIVP